jgi:hypothetical protein
MCNTLLRQTASLASRIAEKGPDEEPERIDETSRVTRGHSRPPLRGSAPRSSDAAPNTSYQHHELEKVGGQLYAGHLVSVTPEVSGVANRRQDVCYHRPMDGGPYLVSVLLEWHRAAAASRLCLAVLRR